MSNSFTFHGRLGKDSELRQVGDTSVLNFSVANDTGFGEKKVSTWYNCALWGKQGERLEQYLVKGKAVFIAGELQPRPYTSKDGLDKLSLDVRINAIDFVGSKADAQETQEPVPKAGAPALVPAQGNPVDEDLPF